jgi:hypothetical protein
LPIAVQINFWGGSLLGVFEEEEEEKKKAVGVCACVVLVSLSARGVQLRRAT